MDAKVVDGWPKGHEIRILITNSDAAQVNAIRRALIADVPKLAITRVDFNQELQLLYGIDLVQERLMKSKLKGIFGKTVSLILSVYLYQNYGF